MAQYDGQQKELARTLAPEDSDDATNRKAFAILCGAASVCAARYTDQMDLGGELSEWQRRDWATMVSLLLEMADSETPDEVRDCPLLMAALEARG